MRLDKAKDRSMENTWKPLRKYGKLVQFKARSGHAIVLYNTLPAVCIEKVVCMKTKEDLCHKIC